jgi:RNA polymerase sigma-70 factor (ECF subfamily)
VEKYEKTVFSAIATMMEDEVEADDIAQEVFLKVHRSLHRFKGDSQFSVWLYRIAINQCLDRIKHRKRRPEAVSLDRLTDQMDGRADALFRDPEPDAAEQYEQKEMQEIIHRMLDALSPEHRVVVLLKDIEGMSQEDIAAIMNCPVGTIKSRLTRAREALKERLRPFYEVWKSGG